MFIVDLTPGFNGLGKYNCKTRRETYTFWDLLHIIWIRFGWGRFGYELLWGRLGWGRFGVGPFWPVTHYISGVAVVFEDKWPQDITMMRLFANLRDKALSENTMTQWDTNLFTTLHIDVPENCATSWGPWRLTGCGTCAYQSWPLSYLTFNCCMNKKNVFLTCSLDWMWLSWIAWQSIIFQYWVPKKWFTKSVTRDVLFTNKRRDFCYTMVILSI